MQKKILTQLESLGFTLQSLQKTKWNSVAAGSFSNLMGQTCLLFYPKPYSPAWPQWTKALDDMGQQFQLIRSSNKEVVIQINTRSDNENLLAELSERVSVATEKSIFTPELGFRHSQNQKPSKGRILAPAMSFGFAVILGLGITPMVQEESAETQPTENLKDEPSICLTELPDRELQKQTIELLAELELPAFSEGSVNLEAKNGILEISPEQSIGGMTLLSVRISCVENDESKQLKFSSDVKTKGLIRLVENN